MIYTPELNEIYMSLDRRAFFSNRLERVVIDVYESVSGLESGGVVSFWDADINHNQVIKSFEKLGEKKVVDLLKEAKSHIKGECGSEIIDSIDIRIWGVLDGISCRLLNFIKKENIVPDMNGS